MKPQLVGASLRKDGGRTRAWIACAVAAAFAFVLCRAEIAVCAGPKAADQLNPTALSALVASGQASVQTVPVKQSDTPIRVIRGLSKPANAAAASQTEVVSFGPDRDEHVKVVRGPAAPRGEPGTQVAVRTGPGRTEMVTFADPLLAPVKVVRGPAPGFAAVSVDLFGPANGGELDRIAFAVDGVESRHGADPRMWRPSLTGPQGPMQVSAAAALDVGGGDRFDLQQNRLLGRAYLAQMYQRYGNWRDAVAAYNWGPGNLDQWIAGGRDADRMPAGVSWYINRVLHDALITISGL